MAIVRLTKEVKFEMAHALWNYNGLCKNIHGHSYRLFVTLKGLPISDTENVKLGMLMDFGDLKKILNEEVVDKYDHAIVIYKNVDQKLLSEIPQMFGRVIFSEYQPTCENLVADFAIKIGNRLPAGVILHSVKLYETATSYAEWFAEDQK
ncbi:MAG: 6-carboxytetrahydropterin synthase [Bacteroidales bacterium]|nr:6-carboxytetrahydropterin synthase [Bacteroidales bacterium]